MRGNPAQEEYPKSIKNISKIYQKRIMGSRRDSESITNISKHIKNVSRRISDSIKIISKAYQKYIKNISKTYHVGEARSGRVSKEYQKHIPNISKTYHGAQPSESEYPRSIEF